MDAVALTDGDVAALARQAVDLLDPELDIRIEPEDRSDPYRWGRNAWVVHAGEAGPLFVESSWRPVYALFHLVDTLSNDVAETATYWAQPYPPCSPGHRHPTEVDWDDPDDPDDPNNDDRDSDGPQLAAYAVTLRCPLTGETVAELVPDLRR